jgi:hypothetical protein
VIHLVAISGLVCVMVMPRAAVTLRGVGLMAVLFAAIAGLGWFGWAAGLPTATDRALVILIGAPVLAALAMGLVVRAVVVGRGWPIGPDLVATAGGAAILIFSYLRLFDLI